MFCDRQAIREYLVWRVEDAEIDWFSWRQKDYSGIQYPWRKPKIEKAIAIIQEWLEVCNYQVHSSMNSGKDSLVSSHLIRQVYPNCPMASSKLHSIT